MGGDPTLLRLVSLVRAAESRYDELSADDPYHDAAALEAEAARQRLRAYITSLRSKVEGSHD